MSLNPNNQVQPFPPIDEDKQSRKTAGGGSYFFNSLLRRSVTSTTGHSRPKQVPLEPYKLTRSRSANYFREVTNNDVQLLASQSFPNLTKSSSPDKSNHNTIISPSIFNETLLSTAGATPMPSPERYPSVIINKPMELNIADLKLDAVSPLTGDTLKVPEETQIQLLDFNGTDSFEYKRQQLQELPLQQHGEGDSGSNYSTLSRADFGPTSNDEDISGLLSSGAMNKLKLNHSSLSKRSVFQELLTPAIPNDEQDQPKDDVDSDGLYPSHNVKKNNKIHKIVEIVLGIFILILVGGFVPAIIILNNGTEITVKRFFDHETNRQLLFPYLNEKYGNLSTFNPKVVNTPEGLSPLYKNDPKIIALMEGYGEPIFHGLAYSPMEALEPSCGMNKSETVFDLVKLSTVTSRIRNYGMQCNQSDFILDAIQSLKLNMTLSMGVWIGKNDTINRMQLNSMKETIRKYPQNMIDSIFIGNEVLFREDKTTSELIEYIMEAKKFLKSIGYKNLPVGTSEIGSLLNKELFDKCDILGANIHPFFAGNSVEGASNWSMEFLEYQMEPLNFKNKTIIVTEVGWPTNGGNFHRSFANIPNFKYFISDYICKMKNVNYGWYYFEAFDEPWKRIFYEGKNKWETSWGVFNSDRSNKIDLRKLGTC